jgi:hypothetical protein
VWFVGFWAFMLLFAFLPRAAVWTLRAAAVVALLTLQPYRERLPVRRVPVYAPLPFYGPPEPPGGPVEARSLSR